MPGKTEAPVTLAARWSPPSSLPAGSAGSPLVCVASTYTFHASFFETELLPRFLGLKFDETEGTRAFLVEREQALAEVATCVLVDADQLDPSQTTLRWDQLPVRIRGGVQHAKVVVLLWENCARLIVSSANLTRRGYRRNREIVGEIDFFNDASSAPRGVLLDALRFLQSLGDRTRVSDGVRRRLRQALEDVRTRVVAWRDMPATFGARAKPRVNFIAGLPGQRKGSLDQLIELWGTSRADEIAVMTPFVGDLCGTEDQVIDRLMELPRTGGAKGYLVVPGRPHERDPEKVIVDLPRRFRDAWATAWGVAPRAVTTYAVPPCRVGEKANRDLHAKGILVQGERTAMLLCGSSNFSPHGMGVGAANAEANLCYIDERDVRRDGSFLEDRLPVNWKDDECEGAFWPETVEPIEDERPSAYRPLPPAFLHAIYNQRTAVLTLVVAPTEPLPTVWALRLLGESQADGPTLLDQDRISCVPVDGKIAIQLPDTLRGANIAVLRLTWREGGGDMASAILPVHVEGPDSILPPDEFRALTADSILLCLLSGLEPAEWVDAQERQRAAEARPQLDREIDSLRVIDTSGYVLYRMRRLGAALSAMGERLEGTVATSQALNYRLRQDPLGPLMLAEALIKEWQVGQVQGAPSVDPVPLLFALAEIVLTLAHAGRKHTKSVLRDLFARTVQDIESLGDQVVLGRAVPANLATYRAAVKREQTDLLKPPGKPVHVG